MSGPTLIDPRAATRMDAALGEAALSWICPSCGQTRGFEGGRPEGHADCPECGCRIAEPRADLWARPRRAVVASTNSYLF
jgi:predicted RNA-binding Zn-ribbon protein involved in translation (DUF1610 family)